MVSASPLSLCTLLDYFFWPRLNTSLDLHIELAFVATGATLLWRSRFGSMCAIAFPRGAAGCVNP